jgi:hypothetical protein
MSGGLLGTLASPLKDDSPVFKRLLASMGLKAYIFGGPKGLAFA